MDSAVTGLSATNTYYSDTKSPPVEAAQWNPVLPCDLSSNTADCYHFVFAPVTAIGSDRAGMEAVVREVRSVLNLSAASTRYFPSADAASSFLQENQTSTLAAVYFSDSASWNTSSNKPFTYTLRVNETRTCKSLGTFECNKPRLDVTLPLQMAIDSAFLRVFAHKENARIEASFSDFPHPDMPNNFDVLQSYGSSFLYIAISFNYVIQLVLIVEEKESHLIESMDQMGLSFMAYWLAWFLVDTAVNTIMVLLILAFGYMMQFELFLETPPGLLLSFFWLSAMAFTGMAFFFSTLTKKSSTAR